MLRHLPKNAAMQRLDLELSARQQHVLPKDRVHQSGPRQRPRFRQQRPNTASKNNKVLLIKDGGLKRTHVCIVVAAVYCGLHSVVRLGCPSQPSPVLLRTDVVFPMSFLSPPHPYNTRARRHTHIHTHRQRRRPGRHPRQHRCRRRRRHRILFKTTRWAGQQGSLTLCRS